MTVLKPSDVIGALQLIPPPTYNNDMHIVGRIIIHPAVSLASDCPLRVPRALSPSKTFCLAIVDVDLDGNLWRRTVVVCNTTNRCLAGFADDGDHGRC